MIRAIQLVLTAILALAGCGPGVDYDELRKATQAVSDKCPKEPDGSCLTWEARDYTFTPDSKSLLLSYDYRNGTRPASPYVAVRIDLTTLSVTKLQNRFCSSSIWNLRASPDGKRLIALVNASWEKSGEVGKSNTNIAIFDMVDNSMQLIASPSGQTLFQPFFGKDARYLHFVTNEVFQKKSLVWTYDLDVKAYVDFSTKRPFNQGEPSKGLPLPFSTPYFISFDVTENNLLFRSSGSGAPDYLSLRLEAKRSQANRNPDIMNFFFRYDIASRDSVFDELNSALDADFAAGSLALGLGWMQAMPNGDIYFLKDLTPTKQTSRQIFAFRVGKAEPFVTLADTPVVWNFATAPYIFAVSPDRRWVAYTYQTNAGATTGTDILTILDRQSNTTRVVDLGSPAFRRLATAAGCVG